MTGLLNFVIVVSVIICTSCSEVRSSDKPEVLSAELHLKTEAPASRSPTVQGVETGPDKAEGNNNNESSDESSESDEDKCSLTFKVPAQSFTSCEKTERIEESLAVLKGELGRRLRALEERVQNVLSDEADKSIFRELEEKVYELQRELNAAIDVETQSTNHPVFKRIFKNIEEEKEGRVEIERRLRGLEARNQDIDCRLMGRAGVFTIHPLRGPSEMKVYCDNKWLVIQRRVNGSVSFYRDWQSYRSGFGDFAGEFWLGNQHIHHLTTQTKYKLRIELEDWHARTFYAEYSHFFIENENENFRLHLSGFTGNTVDSMIRDESRYGHNGMTFTTYDRNNGPNQNVNCAGKYQGGWWYNDCYASNLNGRWCDPNDPNKLSCIIWYGLFTKHVIEKVTLKIKENV